MAGSLRGDWQEQLVSLRALTALTGALHDAQVMQLKHWGAIAFPHVEKGRWEIQVEPDNRVVTYALRPPRRARRPAHYAQLIAALDRSIHWLLGDEWATCITEHGKAIYQGERQVADEKVNDQRKSRAAHRAGVSIAQ
jgi:hypothetical protein